jgi:adenylate cyclase
MAVQRRLAAILAADVAGYSRLMGEDEEGTRTRFNAQLDEVISPAIDQHRGRLVKTMGDGFLVEFASVVAAIECAADIQAGIASRQSGELEGSKMLLRIGIHLGDVIVEEDDIHGDGVNIAARLEGLAEPGGICVSEMVHAGVRNKLAFEFTDLGEQSLKNIAEPVHAFQIRGHAAPAKAGEALPLPDKPSIAILAFDNMSGDAEQEYFSDGIAEDIITDISKISGLFVIARNSSFAYKGQALEVKRVARELGVKFVLEGSVRKAANRVRITAQLIDGTTGGHLWAERYDRVLEDIFAIQDEITRHIVDALKVELALDERARIGGPATTSIEAYDLALRAREFVFRSTREDNAEATRLYERAIELDPEFIAAHADLAIALFTARLNGWIDDDEATLERGNRMAARAIELDPDDPQGYWASGFGLLWRQDLDGALAMAEKATALSPSYAEAHVSHGYILSYASRPAEAINSIETAMRLDPQHPRLWLHFLAHAHFVAGDYDIAASILERRIRLQPETDISRVLLASCQGQLGLIAEAQDQWAELRRVNPNYSIEQRARVLPYENPADWDRFVEGLRKAGVQE